MIDTQKLLQHVKDKLVSVQAHPTGSLYIYNYTPRVQYEKLWDDVTKQTRGLILDSDMNIVAKPFGKFFNYEEHSPEEIPTLPFEVFDKLDGSLGILYWLNDIPYIATRGSFESDQAIHATNILHTRYFHLFDKLDQNKTYLFEIIYPANRIVVDYKGYDDIVLIAIIENETGHESLEDIGFPLVKKFDGINDISNLRMLNDNEREGFVIRFSNGFRIKMKFAEYFRLHRIITQVSNVVIWEYMSEGKDFQELLDRVPDEFYYWVKSIQKNLIDSFNLILTECREVFTEFDSRKETAFYFQTQKYPHVLFSMLDKKDPDKIIWKMIKPKYSKPFKQD